MIWKGERIDIYLGGGGHKRQGKNVVRFRTKQEGIYEKDIIKIQNERVENKRWHLSFLFFKGSYESVGLVHCMKVKSVKGSMGMWVKVDHRFYVCFVLGISHVVVFCLEKYDGLISRAFPNSFGTLLLLLFGRCFSNCSVFSTSNWFFCHYFLTFLASLFSSLIMKFS